ncbi:GNAT family N-acetyltransferase [Fictibacillus phosphorivorans]|uniref:GNAT family N-acetyltransferase n=1 Tax=Fictibacillus phosphorivorans TaxID=1221500 RepID=UPI00203F4199|nr:GNAT family protein [Fictibacillus phosphorivorans]MCM3719002.1 GNAT family N-acetyltransferase [Fictibacillus phosphorivorans]MCM3776624.1 GNAT family N-acetyltransferase [Fictibacillus phosphorivorans]
MITGKLVELRPVSLEDHKRSYLWRNDEETAKLDAGSGMYRYSHTPLEKIEASYEKDILSIDKREVGEFSIYTLGDDARHIGSIGYRDLHIVSRRCVVGIGIGEKELWGKGYGTDALKALVSYLFKTMNLRRIQLDTWSGNTRAIRSYEKVGFVIEGRLREDTFIDGNYYDTIVMGLLREDFHDEA